MAKKLVVNKRFFWPLGCKLHAKRELGIKNGHRCIVDVVDKNGNVMYDDWYGMIQKPAASCNIRTLLETAISTDNLNLLKQVNKISADLTVFPKDLLEAQKDLIKAKEYFDSLPTPIKNDFGNNYMEFIKRQGKTSELFNEKFFKKPVNVQNDNTSVDNNDNKENK